MSKCCEPGGDYRQELESASNFPCCPGIRDCSVKISQIGNKTKNGFTDLEQINITMGTNRIKVNIYKSSQIKKLAKK